MPTPSAFPADNATIYNTTIPLNSTDSGANSNSSFGTAVQSSSTQATVVTQLSRVILTYTLGSGSDASVRTITVTHTNTQLVTLYTTVVVDATSTVASPMALSSSAGVAFTGLSSLSMQNGSTTPFSNTPVATSSPLSAASSPTSTILNAASTSLPTSSVSTSVLSSTTVAAASSVAQASACASVVPPATTQEGIVAGCSEWYVAVPGDYCYVVADRFGLDVYTFMAWNPAVVYPSCSNMLAGNAYCVATCGTPTPASSHPVANTIASTLAATIPGYATSPSSSTAAAAPTASSGAGIYRSYTGDGSTAAGWPTEKSWIDYDTMFEANIPQMKASCSQWGVTDDSDEEIADMRAAISTVASESGVDPRVILAVIMQESTGCVRVITTAYSVQNPGLMQSHAGNGTCNGNGSPLNVPGTSVTASSVQVPCPETEITQMIRDGTQGTSSGDGLAQLYAAQTAAGHTDAQAWYRTVRAYNGGSVAANNVLEDGCCTASYASDIANRLTGWTTGPRTFTA